MTPQVPHSKSEHNVKEDEKELELSEEGEEVVLAYNDDGDDGKDDFLLAEATSKKEEGNAHFANQHFEQADVSYQQALETLSGLGTSLSSNPKSRELHISLHSNMAIVNIRAQRYEEAEQHCTMVISNWDDSVAKIWYRRGQAREHLGKLEEALEDLKSSVRLLRQQKQQNNLIKTALQAMDRVQKQLSKEQKDVPMGPAPAPSPIPMTPTRNSSINGTGMNGHSIAPTRPPPPPPEQQKQDVLRLLISRSVVLKQHPVKGEALLILDWKWWCQWCRHVHLFEPAQSDRIRNVLVPGAVVPPVPKKKPDEEEDDSSTDSEDQADLGPIDNSALFLLPDLDSTNSTTGQFRKHWYRHFQRGDPPLRPNLVRGFHYEIIPREVYAALAHWYGENTVRILRRTRESASGKLELDLYSTHPDNKPSDTETKQQHQHCAACRANSATKRCTRCTAVWYCQRTCQEAHWSHHKQQCAKIAQQRKNGSSESIKLPLPDGRVGLNNLGNTCFMNSALQCLSHATPLTRHFLSNQFLLDINTNNPLGTGGKLAHAFENCLKELWWKNQTSTSPTALKRAISLFAPRFAGCLQHDAQEFLAYLLDGLHEDLNRIKKAPYVEMPDFDDNGAATHVNASLAWNCHLQRNDSLIMDTFYGQFKSTCVCPCGRVSVSFDAFNHVSLEIPQPQQSTVWIPFLVFGQSGAMAAVKYGIGLPHGSSVADFRRALSKIFGVPSTHMVICEVCDNTIVEILRDDKPVRTIGPNDTITVYKVEPYTSSSMHIVASHAFSEEINSEEALPTPFGLPFLSSCDANLTCRQLCDHVWSSVRHLVVPLSDDGKLEDDLDPELEEVYKQLVHIRVTDSEGNSTMVFPTGEQTESSNPQEEEKNEAETLENSLSPYVPRNVEEQIKFFLGEDCTTRFLFLSLEWATKMDVPQELLQKNAVMNTVGTTTNNKKKKKMKKLNVAKAAKVIPKTVGILEKRFLAVGEHSTYHECIKKKREMDAARGVTLDQCFETFTKPERLDQHNMWYCSNCKEHVRALKTMELWRLPNILMVHLKRFEFKHRRDKLATFVDYPVEGLDMSKHCAQWKDGEDSSEQLKVNDRVPAIYDLFAVVNHYGRMGFGHYTAFARKWDEDELSNDWGLFDDSSARSVGSGRDGTGGVVDDVVSPAAYVLFYRRRTFN